MHKTEILVIGRHPEIMEKVLLHLNLNEKWNAVGAQTDEQAIELFHQYHFDLVLLGGGIEAESEKKFRSLFTFQQPEILIIQQVGGNISVISSELNSGIQQVLEKKKKERMMRMRIMDSFQNLN